MPQKRQDGQEVGIGGKRKGILKGRTNRREDDRWSMGK